MGIMDLKVRSVTPNMALASMLILFASEVLASELNKMESKPHRGALASASSSADGHEAVKSVDGYATDDSAWMGDGQNGERWLQLDFAAPVSIVEVHLHSGIKTIKGSTVGAAEIQVREGEDWKKVGEFSGNKLDELRIKVEGGPIEMTSLRFLIAQEGPVAVRELAVYGEEAPLGIGLEFYGEGTHLVAVNQIGYNEGYPKRFTVPTATKEGVRFALKREGDAKDLFTGEIKNGIGDFSEWSPEKEGNYTIHVEGGAMDAAESFPFAVGNRVFQKALLQPMVDFMIDARSVVGSHPSAYGGAAWRDGSYYTHELASLCMLYLAFPDEIGKMPRQIDWKAEKAKVLNPGFKFIRTRLDDGVLEATREYYTRFEEPADDAPDLVKLIHWGVGMTLTKPMLMDPSGDGIGMKIHPQLVEQLAYVLALRPRLEEWLPKSLFDEAERFVEREWHETGLFGFQSEWNPRLYKPEGDPNLHMMGGTAAIPYKGRHVPGHSILPNLLMYEACRKSGRGGSDRYLSAALEQAGYVLTYMDWTDPRHTKGHRMSEHKMITGLVWLQQNYPKHAPKGLKQKLEQWADIAIARSDNEWDFRRYDLKDHWSIPKMNEPGNLGGFPACALSVSWIVEDPAKKKRLREIAIAALDCLFGRNPINSASPYHPQHGWNGMIERGWPVGFPDGTSARLETCRGSLSSAPGTEMFPFNPRGRSRHPEGWSAFNAAMNVGLAYIEFDPKSHAGLPADCIKQEKQ